MVLEDRWMRQEVALSHRLSRQTRPHQSIRDDEKKYEYKPRALVAQAKLAEVNSEDNIKGKKIPPSDPAQLAMPVAKPRRILNQWPIVPIATVDRSDVPRPARTPKTRMNW